MPMKNTPTDLIYAWELQTQKIMSLLEYSLILRVQIKQLVSDSEFSDEEFINSLEHNLIQLKAVSKA